MSGYVFLFFVSLHMTKKFLFLFKMRGMIKFWIRKEGSKTVVGGGGRWRRVSEEIVVLRQCGY